MASEELSARSRLREWVTEQVEGKTQYSIPTIADEAIDQFSSDRSFVRGFMNETMRPMVYDVVREVVGRSRQYVVLGDEVVSQAVLKARSKPLLGKFEKWMEHAGKGHYRFLEMTREQVGLALGERKKRVYGELVIIRLEEHVFSALAPGERVGDRFTADGLEVLEREIAVQTEEVMDGGDIRSREQVVQPVLGDGQDAGPSHGRRAKGSQADRGLAA